MQKFVFQTFLLPLYAFQIFCFLRKLAFPNDRSVSVLRRTDIVRLFDYHLLHWLNIRKDRRADELVRSLPFVSLVLLNFCYLFVSLGLSLSRIKFTDKVKVKCEFDYERIIARIKLFDEEIKNAKEKQIVVINGNLTTEEYGSKKSIFVTGSKYGFKFKKQAARENMSKMPNYVNLSLDQIDTKSSMDLKTLLTKKGYNPKLPTLFVLEEVVFSHRKDIAVNLLDQISQFKCSRVILDYFDSGALTFWMLFFMLFCRKLIFFGIKSKKRPKRAAETFFKRLGFSIEQHTRFESFQYGIMVASTKKKKSKRRRRMSSASSISLALK